MNKNIPDNERLIFALDVPTLNQAIALIDELDESVMFYKVGLEFLMSGEYFNLLKILRQKNKKIFADLKLLDIPQTIASAVKNLSQYQVNFCTIHSDNLAIPAAVRDKGQTKILAVSVLTSHAQSDLAQMGINDTVENAVLLRAKLSINLGADGVIASGKEAKMLRQKLGDDFIIITPGIRDDNDEKADQKRTVAVEEAFGFGADYIVVGRPIRNAINPRLAAENIQKRIKKYFSS